LANPHQPVPHASQYNPDKFEKEISMNKSTMKYSITLAALALALVAGSVMALGKMEFSGNLADVSLDAKQKAQTLCEANCNDAEHCRNSIDAKNDFGKMWLNQAAAGNAK
jgi:hypothetical protein